MKHAVRSRVGWKGLILGLASLWAVAAMAPAANASLSFTAEVVNQTGEVLELLGEPTYYGGGLGGSMWSQRPGVVVPPQQTANFGVTGAWFGKTTAHVTYRIGSSSETVELDMDSGFAKISQTCKTSSSAYVCYAKSQKQGGFTRIPTVVFTFTVTQV